MTVVDDAPATDELLTLDRIARSLHLNMATVTRMEARGDFPQSLKLPIRKKLYLRSRVEAWWRTVLGGQNGEPFPLAPAELDDDDD
jgi:predicted DNA-binding transcriptional regulator AlpA